MNRGFTVVEVIVTMVVITIILGLGTVGLRASLANARDSERQSDIETIARGLEQRYDRTYSFNWMEDTNSDGTPDTIRTSTFYAGNYPGASESWDVFFYWRRAGVGDALPGVTEEAWKSPSGIGLQGGSCILYGFSQPKCDFAEKPSNIQEAFSNGSGGWRDIYMYEFVGPDGLYCNGNCTRYNLYWLSETKPTNIPSMGIPGLQVWRSKHQ
ncbi:MAG: prepilin-type N-terminal cleavage/methylation domain-containing protein [Candidatus Saccharimonadales bacterium]